jgi:hypothetical protein
MGDTNASSAVGGAGHRPGINVVELHRYRIYLRIHLRVFATYETSPLAARSHATPRGTDRAYRHRPD